MALLTTPQNISYPPEVLSISVTRYLFLSIDLTDQWTEASPLGDVASCTNTHDLKTIIVVCNTLFLHYKFNEIAHTQIVLHAAPC